MMAPMVDADEHVVLVDELDRETGTANKLIAHRQGMLHRAFSIIILDNRDRFLLQKRAIGKYHSGGLWTNSCCSHPRPDENIADAAHRRLLEEMGFDCGLTKIFSTIYRAELDRGMTEHELVHIFAGRYEGPVCPEPDEAEGFAWITEEELLLDIQSMPQRYSVWFRLYVERYWNRLAGLPRQAA